MGTFCLLAAGLLQAASIAQAPLTPGTAAMLVNRSDDQYRPTLKQALADSDVAVRAVAARVAGVRHQGDMIPALEGALAAEHDAIASTEQTRALRLLRHVSTGAPPADATPAHTAIRTIPQIVPGLLSSLLEANRCKPAKRGAFGAARLAFDGDGVVIHSEIDPSQLPGSCKAVLSTMARLTIADDDPIDIGVRSLYLLLPIDAEFVACSEQPRVPPLERGRTLAMYGSSIVPPKKTRDVKPEYPAGAQQNRVQGIVGVLARITAAGCINDARVVLGVDPALDFAALQAVTAWRYEPARIDGSPRPVLMNVSVSFRLQ